MEKFRREHRKSFGKTEKLFRSKPLSQKGFGKRLELLEGARIVLGTSGNFSEKKTGSVPELPEPLWLLFAEENH
jgi:hypothetical protein